MVLTPHRYPHFLPIWREEGLVRCTPHIGYVFDRIGRGVDESHRVAADRDDGKRSAMGLGDVRHELRVVLAERREIAKRWGADVVIDPTTEDAVAIVKDVTGGGADAVALTVGSHDAVGPAIKLVRNQGTINLFAGFPPGKTVPFDPNVIHYGEINLTGSQNATTDQYRRTINMLAHVAHIDEVVITNTIPMSAEAKTCPKIRQLSVAFLFAETIRRISDGESVTSLFSEQNNNF